VQLHSSLLDAESALTGHLATGQPRFLGLLETARKAVGDSQSRLSGVIGGDDPQAIASLNEIRREIVAEMGLLDGMRQTGGASLVNRERSRWRSCRPTLCCSTTMKSVVFTEAHYQRDLARQRLFKTVILCGILGPIGALFMHLVIADACWRRLRIVHENARRLAHGLPLEPPPTGADEIASLGQQLESADFLLHARERETREASAAIATSSITRPSPTRRPIATASSAASIRRPARS